MTDRPILFSGPMVRALLDGRKTQTRRIVKPQPAACDHRHWPDDPEPRWAADADGWHCGVCGNGITLAHDRPSGVKGIRCPYGVPGDRLWVKETWRPHESSQPWDLDITYAADSAIRTIKDGEFGEKDWTMPKAAAFGYVSPLFMPRWASRLTLAITDVRVERLQDITEADAKAEGVERQQIGTARNPHWMTYSASFADIWDHINGAGTWDENPWVWVVSFAVQRA